MENHLIPYFGKGNLQQIRPIDIQSFYNSKTHLSDSMLKKMKMCLNAIFDTAIDNELCFKKPSKNIAFKSEKIPNKKTVYTDGEMEAMKTLSKDTMPEIAVFLGTGLRRGELLGLKWEDINFEQKTISVNRSIAKKQGGGIKDNPPKWNSYRTNPIDDRTLAILQNVPNTSEFVFPSFGEDRPQNPSTWSEKLDRFMELIQKNHPQIPGLSAHELRHTYGTSLRRKGVEIYTIQKVMGHKDIKMTSEIYVHNELDTLRSALKLTSGVNPNKAEKYQNKKPFNSA